MSLDGWVQPWLVMSIFDRYDQVIRALSAPPPSAANLNDYMRGIAKSRGVTWTPEPRRSDLLVVLLIFLTTLHTYSVG